jgi:outer membrane protein assembly factor BamD
MNKNFIFKSFKIKLIIIFFIINACSNNDIKKTDLNQKSLDLQVLEVYQQGMKSLNDGDVLFAAKKFNEVEIIFPQSEWAPKSALMAAYAYYSQDYYANAISELERFLVVYPNHKYLDYAYYLAGLSYYEQIVDEKKDLDSIIQAKYYFSNLINKFPNTDYSIDAEFKIDLINDILASKEMYIGRYYFDKKKWIPAINRFRTVVDEYETTIYTEEALHRLVETYYILGLKKESQKYASVLGYNYGSSEWYKNTYLLFNEKHQLKKKKENKKNLIKKFKSLFE